MVLWVVAGLALLVALLALASARRAARRLETLYQSYWELRYEFTRLRSRVAAVAPADRDDEPAPAPAEPGSQVTFVPLSSMKKKNG